MVAGGEWNHSWVLRFINLPWMKIQNYIFQYFPVKNEKKCLPGWSSERLTMSPALTSKLLLCPAAEIQLPRHTFTYLHFLPPASPINHLILYSRQTMSPSLELWMSDNVSGAHLQITFTPCSRQLPRDTFTYNTLSTGFACMYFFFMYINFTADELIRSQFICGMMTLQTTWNMVRRTDASS